MANRLYRHYYLEHVLSREMFELFLTVSFQNFALSLFVLFEPVYLYSLGYSITWVVFYYLIVYIFYFALLPLGGKLAVRYGFEHSIGTSFLFLFLYLIVLFFVSYISILFFIAPLIAVAYKLFFWPSYHANFSRYGKRSAFGKEVGFLAAVFSVISILGPLIGGFIVSWFGFPVLFVVVGLVLMLAIVPIFSTRERFIPGSFSYIEAFRFFFSKKMRRLMISLIGLSGEVVEAVIWPIFLIAIVGEYSSLGIIGSIAGIGGAFVVLLVGKAADLRRRVFLIHGFTWPQILGFLLRFVVHIPFIGLLVTTFSRGAKSGFDVALYSSMYEHGRRQGNVKIAVFFEMCFAFFKLMFMALLIILFILFPTLNPYYIAFGIAALVSSSFILFR